jgi:hypothetical protein
LQPGFTDTDNSLVGVHRDNDERSAGCLDRVDDNIGDFHNRACTYEARMLLAADYPCISAWPPIGHRDASVSDAGGKCNPPPRNR